MHHAPSTNQTMTHGPGAKATQVADDNSFCSRITYVKSAAVPPPKECPTICHKEN